MDKTPARTPIDVDKATDDLQRAVTMISALHGVLPKLLPVEHEGDPTDERIVIEAVLEKAGALIERATSKVGGEWPGYIGGFEEWADFRQ